MPKALPINVEIKHQTVTGVHTTGHPVASLSWQMPGQEHLRYHVWIDGDYALHGLYGSIKLHRNDDSKKATDKSSHTGLNPYALQNQPMIEAAMKIAKDGNMFDLAVDRWRTEQDAVRLDDRLRAEQNLKANYGPALYADCLGVKEHAADFLNMTFTGPGFVKLTLLQAAVKNLLARMDTIDEAVRKLP